MQTYHWKPSWKHRAVRREASDLATSITLESLGNDAVNIIVGPRAMGPHRGRDHTRLHPCTHDPPYRSTGKIAMSNNLRPPTVTVTYTLFPPLLLATVQPYPPSSSIRPASPFFQLQFAEGMVSRPFSLVSPVPMLTTVLLSTSTSRAICDGLSTGRRPGAQPCSTKVSLAHAVMNARPPPM